MLEKGLELMRAWKFKYRTVAFTWIKTNRKNGGIYHGLGHWTAGNAELVLLGKRGSPKRVTRNIKQIVMAPVSRHSAKPLIIKEKIVELMGNKKRIEIFAREKTPGWTSLGLGIDGVDIRESIKKLIK